MKDIMYVFLILLVLLIIISTLGGSVRPKELFVESSHSSNQLMAAMNSMARESIDMAPEPISMGAPQRALPIMMPSNEETKPMSAPQPVVMTKPGFDPTIEPFDDTNAYAVF